MSQTETDFEFIYIQVGQYSFESDSVTIHDGSNEQSTQIEKLSGDLGSFNILSTGNYLFVKFKSDGYGQNNDPYDGFHATVHYGNSYLNIK